MDKLLIIEISAQSKKSELRTFVSTYGAVLLDGETQRSASARLRPLAKEALAKQAGVPLKELHFTGFTETLGNFLG